LLQRRQLTKELRIFLNRCKEQQEEDQMAGQIFELQILKTLATIRVN
jgi:hypothetical protein